MNKFSIFAITILVVFISVKNGASGIRITFLDNYEHSGNLEDVVWIGNGDTNQFIQEHPIGTSYTIYFDLDVEPAAGRQFLLHLEHYEASNLIGYPSGIYLNGILLEEFISADPYVHWLSQYIRGDNNILKIKNNELKIISGIVNTNHDDLEFTNLYLEYTPISTIPIEKEAEDGDIYGWKFNIGSDPNASGGQYVWAPNGSGNKWTLSESQRVEYGFSVEQEGYYRIKGRVYAPNDNDDSFWVKVNGEPFSGYLWDVLQNTDYLPDYVSDRDGEDPVEVCLPAGTHTVAVYWREDGTRLDTIALEFVRSGSCF
jgi:hypothetical protein